MRYFANCLRLSKGTELLDMLEVLSFYSYNVGRTGKEVREMKIILKILFAPIIIVLAVVTWFLTFLVQASGTILGIVSALLVVLGIVVMILDNTKNGIIVIVIAFLVSPYGIPLLAAKLVGQLHRFRLWLKDAIYG